MSKRRRGRPKGSVKLPPEYWHDVRALGSFIGTPKRDALWEELLRRRGSKLPKVGYSDAARNALKRGAWRWLDLESGRVVAMISDPHVLRTRLIEAFKRPKTPMPALRTTFMVPGDDYKIIRQSIRRRTVRRLRRARASN
jgi:hypothetical protein